MASVSSPYGLQPISDQSGIVRPVRIPNGIANQLNQNIFSNQAVKLNPATGTISPVTNPGGVPDQIFGVFMGVEFTPLGGRPTVSPFWPAGTNVDTSFDFFAYIVPAWLPNLRFRIQADGSVAQALLGSQFNITNPTAGSTSTGLGACTVGAAGVQAGSQGQLVLSEFFDINGLYGTIGDAFTDLIVEIAYPQIGAAAQASIG